MTIRITSIRRVKTAHALDTQAYARRAAEKKKLATEALRREVEDCKKFHGKRGLKK